MGSGANPYPQYRDKGAYFYVGEGDGDGEVGGNMGEGGNGDGEEVVSFELVGFNIKPIAVPPGADVRVVVRGYPYPTSTNTNNNKNNDKAHPHQATAAAAKKEEILQWTVTFPEGFDEMFEVRIREFSGEVWTGLRGVEVRALYGVQELDWEFCLDDLVVVFEGVGAGAVGGVGREGMGKEGEEGEGERERGQVVLRGES